MNSARMSTARRAEAATLRAPTPTGEVDVDPDPVARLVCISTDVYASAALQSTVAAILPGARVEAADTSIVRGAPDADCVILGVGRLYSAGVALVRELRARGYGRPIILVVEAPAAADAGALARLGVSTILEASGLALQLPAALHSLLREAAHLRGSPQADAITSSLCRLQATIAAGEMAQGLQHKLNNPLAALLAEAQLLELELLSAEHRASAQRMVELCRRVIEVSRSIDGRGGALGGAADVASRGVSGQ
jgi:signal transduction histidine kinase